MNFIEFESKDNFCVNDGDSILINVAYIVAIEERSQHIEPRTVITLPNGTGYSVVGSVDQIKKMITKSYAGVSYA